VSSTWTVLGWIGQGLFFARFLVQWWASERAGRSVAPLSFWWLSLGATVLVGGYTLERGEPVLLLPLGLNFAIYLRNLLFYAPYGRGRSLPAPVAAGLGLLATGALLLSGGFQPRQGLESDGVWLAIGLLGAALWGLRFLLQWWSSERRGESHFPRSFWWSSLVGNGLLLAYSVHLGDALYIAGYAVGPLVQVRNLMLADGRRAELRPARQPGASASNSASGAAADPAATMGQDSPGRPASSGARSAPPARSM
jgi:lipid-A-disaccharide synthase-like uncharacterized protein